MTPGSTRCPVLWSLVRTPHRTRAPAHRRPDRPRGVPGRRGHHDALNAMGRSVLASGALGQHNGLPATIVISTTLKGAGIRCRTSCHRRRQSAADAGRHSDGILCPSLPGDFRQPHPPTALPRPQQAHRLKRPAHSAARPRPRLRLPGLHRARLRLPSPPRQTRRVGRPTLPMPTKKSWLAARTTDSSKRAMDNPNTRRRQSRNDPTPTIPSRRRQPLPRPERYSDP